MRYKVFTAQPLLLHSGGFSLFGPWHLLWLAVCALVVRGVLCLYRRDVREGRPSGAPGSYPGSRVLRTCSCAMLALLASEDALMIASGTYTVAWWPLHFCNFAEYFCLAYAIRPNRPCRELLLTLGLSGGLMAMLFPGWLACPPYTWPVVCGFMEHALIFSVSLCAIDRPADAPRFKDLRVTYGFVVVYLVFFRWFNARMGSNFGFVSGPAWGTPIELWYDELGDPAYLIPYATLFVVGTLALHLWMRRRRERAGVA